MFYVLSWLSMILAMVVPYLFIKVIERIHDGETSHYTKYLLVFAAELLCLRL